MKNQKKLARLMIFGLALIMLAVPMSAQASQSAEQILNDYQIVTPNWENVNNISLDLYFQNGQAKCVGIVRGAVGTTSINATFTLERRTLFGWSRVASWDRSSTTSTLTFHGAAAASRGNTYRFSVTATVVRNGVSETVTTSVQNTF